ncbi:coiled-coil domain-containing protein 177-like [Penaeus monodon]|uniref:coiled-coil domain-containing protein 177-like n=1 Tax=Penaeus monodon TaxID=6687 RepID=UPI0018A7256A|nr:coiled-coil domain-containing protein 177-like [Penaeus monodon]
MKDPGVKLDLYNYDLPQHESCPYILTSPRSLEACKRLGIKPVELLQKSREEYQAAHPGTSLEEAVVAFHRQERNRLKRLREARELRDRLLLAEERRARQEASGASGADTAEPPAGESSEEGEKGERENSEQEKEEGEGGRGGGGREQGEAPGSGKARVILASFAGEEGERGVQRQLQRLGEGAEGAGELRQEFGAAPGLYSTQKHLHSINGQHLFISPDARNLDRF